jgi:hypothetical protein
MASQTVQSQTAIGRQRPDRPLDQSRARTVFYGARPSEYTHSVLIVGEGVAAMKRFSAWIDAKPGRFRLVLTAHSIIVAAILLTTFHG